MTDRPLRIGVVGNVDAGKSTLIGVLTKLDEGVFDDGRGSARSLVLQHPHERLRGQTSSISKTNKIINNREIQFIDLAGHERYLRTTLSGLSGHCVDYVMLLVSASTSVDKKSMTLEHLRIALALRVPIIIVVTKIDIAPQHVHSDTINKVRLLILDAKKYRLCNKLYIINSDSSFETAIKQIDSHIVPLIEVSNKTGAGIPVLKKFLSLLPPTYKFNTTSNVKNFIIHDTYLVKGVGLVVSGIVTSGYIKSNDMLRIGPINNNIIMVKARTLHGDYKNLVDQLTLGQSGCISIRATDSHTHLRRSDIRRGTWICSEIKLIKRFVANVDIFRGTNVTVKPGYAPVIHCSTARQAAKIIKIKNELRDEEVLRSNDKGEVVFDFIHHNEIINIGQRFMFREGNTRGVGIIMSVMMESEIPSLSD